MRISTTSVSKKPSKTRITMLLMDAHQTLQKLCNKEYYHTREMPRSVTRLVEHVFKRNQFFDHVIPAAIDAALDERINHINKMTVKLSDADLHRPYLFNGFLPGTENGGAPDPLLCNCHFCGHRSVDIDKKWLKVKEKYHRDMEKYQDDLRAYNSLSIKEQAALSGQPKIPKLNSAVLCCHCHQSNCGGDPTLKGNTCIIKCINEATNQHYPIVDGQCTCPYCNCMCKKGISVSEDYCNAWFSFATLILTITIILL